LREGVEPVPPCHRDDDRQIIGQMRLEGATVASSFVMVEEQRLPTCRAAGPDQAVRLGCGAAYARIGMDVHRVSHLATKVDSPLSR
jgi:hypothetical protein